MKPLSNPLLPEDILKHTVVGLALRSLRSAFLLLLLEPSAIKRYGSRGKFPQELLKTHPKKQMWMSNPSEKSVSWESWDHLKKSHPFVNEAQITQKGGIPHGQFDIPTAEQKSSHQPQRMGSQLVFDTPKSMNFGWVRYSKQHSTNVYSIHHWRHIMGIQPAQKADPWIPGSRMIYDRW